MSGVTERTPPVGGDPAGAGQLALSVVIPTRDRRDHLAETLAALAAQEAAPFEVIVAVDGPQAETTEMVRSRAASGDWPADRPLRVLELAWRGPAAARNAAIAVAAAPRTLLLGDDTPPAPGTLARHLTAGGAELGVQGLIEWSPQRTISPVMRFLSPAGPQFYFVDLEPGRVIPPRAMLGSNLSAPTRWLRDEPFDERFTAAVFEDTELAMRWARHGWRVRYDPMALCWHDHEYPSIDAFLVRQRQAGSAARLAIRLHPRLLGSVVVLPALVGVRSALRVVGGTLLGRRGPEDRWDLRCRLAFFRGLVTGAPALPGRPAA